ncbi:MAG TPA: DUF2089 domain-containing protein [Ktedonobacterales bacterium]|nr:DUF2089 domain-containing protein [Ktedonobacterales bacterium]
MYEVSGRCPVCGGQMAITRLACGTCHSALEGQFTVNGAGRSAGEGESYFGRLERLSRDQLEFVEIFLRCRGIIKNVEAMLDISYPTVKARLNNVIESLGFQVEEDMPDPERRRERREILQELAQGKITTEEAHRRLAAETE